MKKITTLLFVILLMGTFASASDLSVRSFVSTASSADASIKITSTLTSAEIGTVVTINYEYTLAAAGNIYCAINKYADATDSWLGKVVDGSLSPAPAGTNLTGSFNFTIPFNTTPTAELTGTQNYRLVITLSDASWNWLAGEYPATQLNLFPASTTPPTASISFTSNLTTAEAGSTVAINYKYSSPAADNYIYCAINRYGDATFNNWEANLVSGQVASAAGGTDVTGSFLFTIPADATLSANLTSPKNYKLVIEMKEKVNWTVLAEQKVDVEINIIASGTLTSNVESPQADNKLNISTKDGAIHLVFDGEKQVDLYSLNGQLISSTTVANHFTQAVKNGAYLLRIDGQAHKVIVH